MSEPVLVAVQAGVQRITLNRPDKLNSFTSAMHALLRPAIERAGSDASIRVVLLTGAGRGFCAGQDLSERDMSAGGPEPDLGAALERLYNPLILAMRALPKPIVCAVNGVAAGAGASLALACDIVLAAHSASFLQAFAKIALVPDAGSTYVLPRRVGMARAMGLALLADKLPAEDAERWGLIWKCCADEQLMAEAEALCARLAEAPTRTLGLIKRALDASTGNTLEQQLTLERESQRAAAGSPDFREGVAAFLEKRAPKFTGR